MNTNEPADAVYKHVLGHIASLQQDTPMSKAKLATLRRGLGKDPADSPEVWSVTMDRMPDMLASKGKDVTEATDAEWAIHITLTLYALHRQGNDRPVYSKDRSFATAIRSLMDPTDETGGPIKRRFDALVTSESVPELGNHARGMVQLLRSADRPTAFDYPALAKDIFLFGNPSGRKSVRLRWGQDFFKAQKKEDKGSEEE